MSLTALWTFLRNTPALTRYLLSAVSLFLKTKPLFETIGRLIFEAAQFANLTAEQRRGYVMDQARLWLNHHGIRVTDQQLALLVEILYGWVKQQHGARFSDKPLDWTGRKEEFPKTLRM